MAFLLSREVLVGALRWILQRLTWRVEADSMTGRATVLLGWGTGETSDDPSSCFWGLRITCCRGRTRVFFFFDILFSFALCLLLLS